MEFNALIPELCVSDLKKSIDFYTNILGFKVEYVREESKFAFLSLGAAQIMLEQNPNSTWHTAKLDYPLGRGLNFQIEVKNLTPILAKLKEENYPLKSESQERWYRKNDVLLGVREFLVQDPDGYLLRFMQSLGQKTSSE